MVGRTPEYLGKKIESYEMKMASLVILVPPLIVLVCTALAVVTEAGRAGPLNPGAHGFSEILYAFSSMGNNNGSAFAGLSANTPFYNLLGGVAMLASRYWIAVPALAIAGVPGSQKARPGWPGHLADAHVAVRGHADRCGDHRRRPDLYPGAGAGADCRASVNGRCLSSAPHTSGVREG